MEMVPKVDRLEEQLKDLREAFLLFTCITTQEPESATPEERIAMQERFAELSQKMARLQLT